MCFFSLCRLGGTQAVSFCVVASQAMQMEYDNTTNVYTYAKLYHQKRPGCWSSPEDLRMIYRILSYLPSDLELLKCTEIRTELDDLTTVTPDLYSKICSNGNISSSLNSNPAQGTVLGANNSGNTVMLMNGNGTANTSGGGGGDDEFSVVVTESSVVATNIDV